MKKAQSIEITQSLFPEETKLEEERFVHKVLYSATFLSALIIELIALPMLYFLDTESLLNPETISIFHRLNWGSMLIALIGFKFFSQSRSLAHSSGFFGATVTVVQVIWLLFFSNLV